MRRRGALVALAVAGLLVLAALLAGGPGDAGRHLDPASTGPTGTRALVLLLEELGATVEIVERPPATADVALVLRDRRGDGGDAGRQRLLAWAREGGTLVVADPRSPLTPEVERGGDELAALGGETALSPGVCDVDALADAGPLEVAAVTFYRVEPGERSCYGRAGEAFVVVRPVGAGQLVALGNAGPLVNERLDAADNAVLAAALLAPATGGRVAVLALPPPGGGDEQLLDLVPDRVWRALAQLALAFLVFAAWRARRLGRPVAETQPVTIAGSELTRASGELWRQRRDPGSAAMVLGAELRASLAARVGLGPTAPPAVLADAVAARTGIDRDEVLRLLQAPPVADDAALVDLARRLDAVRQEVHT